MIGLKKSYQQLYFEHTSQYPSMINLTLKNFRKLSEMDRFYTFIVHSPKQSQQFSF